MINSLVAYTLEIDDIDLAIAEIEAQLDLPNNTKKNTVGIMACNFEFVESGAATAIAEKLPFDVLGSVTTAQAVPGQIGAMLLTLLVLTSDDIEFKVSLTDTLRGDFKTSIEKCYRKSVVDMERSPSLAITLAPFMMENSGDTYMDVFTNISSGVPCFGTLAVDDSPDFANCFTIFNGQHYKDCMVMALLFGDVKPLFITATMSKEKILDSSEAIITSSEGHILKEVNNRPLAEFFEDLGLTEASETAYAMTSVPFMVDYNDGTPQVSKVFIALNEQKHGICAGKMPEGSSLYIGVFDKEDVLLTTGNAVKQALDNKNASTVLMYSCISRNMSLSGDMFAEMETVSNLLESNANYMMAYSGGEICPTVTSTNITTNRFHNNTFVLCAF